MKATEARKIYKEAKQSADFIKKQEAKAKQQKETNIDPDKIAKVLKRIEEAAKKVEKSIKFDEWDIYLTREETEYLRSLGYDVYHYPGGSFDTPEDWTITFVK